MVSKVSRGQRGPLGLKARKGSVVLSVQREIKGTRGTSGVTGGMVNLAPKANKAPLDTKVMQEKMGTMVKTARTVKTARSVRKPVSGGLVWVPADRGRLVRPEPQGLLELQEQLGLLVLLYTLV